uniref:Uncharacterized protein n=1 Tax=Arundo donax TaxID=35708 RepID=A0A0A8ZAF5_ARUDO
MAQKTGRGEKVEVEHVRVPNLAGVGHLCRLAVGPDSRYCHNHGPILEASQEGRLCRSRGRGHQPPERQAVPQNLLRAGACPGNHLHLPAAEPISLS